jgi:8-oxo-dGTP diphosphatase
MRDLWEFPGGKVESGESAAGALQRELSEELGISDIEIDHFRQIEHDYPELQVLIDFFIVSSWQGTPTGIEGQQLHWVDAEHLDTSMLLPADAPVVADLRELLEISKY